MAGDWPIKPRRVRQGGYTSVVALGAQPTSFATYVPALPQAADTRPPIAMRDESRCICKVSSQIPPAIVS